MALRDIKHITPKHLHSIEGLLQRKDELAIIASNFIASLSEDTALLKKVMYFTAFICYEM